MARLCRASIFSNALPRHRERKADVLQGRPRALEGDIIAALVFQKKRWISSDPFFAMAIPKQAWNCSSGLTKALDFIRPFLRHGNSQASLELLIWLNESVL
jgi:hypothetical protein